MKTFREILQILLLLAILLPASVYFMINVPAIQTFLVQKVANLISDKTKTKVSIEAVDFRFFNNLVLKKLYVEDTEGDTLAYVGDVELKLSSLSIAKRQVSFGTVSLSDGSFNLRTKNDTLNLDKLLSRLSSDNIADTTQSEAMTIKLRNFNLNNFKFTMQTLPIERGIPSQINFEDLSVDSIYLSAQNIDINGDTLFFDIKKFQFKEKSRFNIHELTSANAYVCSNRVMLPQLHIVDDYTDLQFNYYAMNFKNGIDDFGDFLNKVRMEADIADGKVAFRTIGFFAHDLAKIGIVLMPKGKVDGTVAALKAKNFNISTLNNQTYFDGDFTITGLPDIDKTVFHGDITQLSSTVENLSAVLKQITGSDIDVIKTFEPVQQFVFNGTFNGFYNKFTVVGDLITPIGVIKPNAQFDFSSKVNDVEITGKAALNNFDVGKIAKTDIVGNVSMNVELRGVAPKNGNFKLYAEGKIDSAWINKYNYHNIQIAGTSSNNAFDGKITCDDPNLKMSFIGRIDMNKTEVDDYRMNFTAAIKYADLMKLNIKTNDSISVFSGNLTADVRGRDINAGGSLKLMNAKFTSSLGTIDIGNMQMLAFQGEKEKRLNLRSDFIDASYVGNLAFGDIVPNITNIIYSYIPNLSDTAMQINKNANYEINLKTKKSGNIVRMFIPELFVSENTIINAKVKDGKFNLVTTSKLIGFEDNAFKNINLNASSAEKLLLNLNCENVTVAGIDVRNVKLQTDAVNNIITNSLTYDNETQIVNRGKINFVANVLKNGTKNLFTFAINPSQLTFNDSTWNLQSKLIKITSEALTVDNFVAAGSVQNIAINGTYSALPNDTLQVKFDNFGISNFNYIMQKEGYSFAGGISGFVKFTQLLRKPVFLADLQTSDIYANDWLLGKMRILSNWQSNKNQLELTATISKSNDVKLNAFGTYTPRSNYFDLTFDLDSFEVKSVEPLIGGELTDLEGGLTGVVRLQGKGGELNLGGNASLNNAGMTIDFLKTHYRFSAPIIFNEKSIQIKNATLYDNQGNTGRLNASATHKNLKGFKFDIELRPNKLLALNTTQKDNDQFYGKAYVSGIATMKGALDNLNFTINVRPEKNTEITVLTESSSISSSDILTFETPDTAVIINTIEEYFAKIIGRQQVADIENESDLNVALNIQMNNNAKLNIITDPLSGDAITGQGSGTLRMEVNPRLEKFKLYGNYTVENGSYMLTIPRLTTKDFLIDNGGQIDFNGDVSKAQLNLTATYNNNLRLSLKNLLIDDSISNINVKSQIYCKLHITGTLEDMNLDPSIEFTNIDFDTKAKAQAMLNTREKVWYQMLGLIAYGNFIPEQQGATNSNSLNSGLMDFLSSQLNSWISKLGLPIDIGVNVRPDSYSGTDVDVNFSWKLFEDRLTINGNVGNKTNEYSLSNEFVGDFDAEIKLNRSGTLKGKIFRYSNDAYSDVLFQTSRSGAGITYQGGFNTWNDLYNSIFHAKRQKERRAQRIRERSIRDSIESLQQELIQQNKNEFEINLDSDSTKNDKSSTENADVQKGE